MNEDQVQKYIIIHGSDADKVAAEVAEKLDTGMYQLAAGLIVTEQTDTPEYIQALIMPMIIQQPAPQPAEEDAEAGAVEA